MPVKKALELNRPLTIAEADDNFSLLHGAPAGTVTISGGVVTVNGAGWYLIDTEGAASTDTLTRINGTTIGDWVELSSVSAARVITVAPGANLQLQNGQSFLLDSIYDSIRFRSFGGDVLAERGRDSLG